MGGGVGGGAAPGAAGVATAVAVAVAAPAPPAPPSAPAGEATGVAAAAAAPRVAGGESEIRSPGRRLSVVMWTHLPSRKTGSSYGLADIWLSVLRVRWRWKTEVDSRRRMVKT